MTTYTTELREHNMCARFYCAICGGDYKQNLVAVELVARNEEGEFCLGGVCPFCLRVGLEHRVKAIRNRMLKLEELESIVGDVETWVTPEQLKEAEEKRDMGNSSSLGIF